MRTFYSQRMRNVLLACWVVMSGTAAFGQLTGVKTIPTDYASIAAFVSDLNTNGVGAGGVTLNVPSGYTETVPAGGYSITATGTSANPIVITGAGTATMPVITAYAGQTAGNLNDAIFKIIGGDYITISYLQMQENAVNTTTTAASNNMTEWGIALLYASTTDGAQNCTITGNVISLNRTYQNTFGIYANATHAASTPTTSATATGTAGGNSGLIIYSNSISNVNNGILVVGPTAAADHNDGVDIGGTSSSTGNTITNFGNTGTFSSYANVSGSVYGILIRNSKNFNVSYNNITSASAGVTSGTLRGIFVQSFSNAPTGTISNTVNNNTFSLSSANASGAISGIEFGSTVSSSTSTTQNVNQNAFNQLNHSVTGSGAIYGIYMNSTSITGMLNIMNNSFNNLTSNTTGSYYFISSSNSTQNSTITGNTIVGTFSKTGAGGTVYGYYNNGSPSGGTSTISNNNFSNITLTGSTSFYGIQHTTSSSQIVIFNNNTVSNITGGSSSVYGIYEGYGNTGSTLNNNNVFGLSGSSNIYGIYITSNTSLNSTGNSVYNLTASGTSSLYGIYISSSTLINLYANKVYSLTGTGAAAVYGINNSSPTTSNIYANKIYGITTSNAGGTVYGITSSGGTTVSIYNNLISGLTAPSASGTNVISGINITSTSTSTAQNVYYNTIYLNASSTGTNFGTSGIYHTGSTTSTTAVLDLRNNIIINESTPAGTGLTVAFRRGTASSTNMTTTSNKNLLYAGMPGASNVIYNNGTASQQLLTDYIANVLPVGHDVSSVTGESFTYGTAGSFFVSLTGASTDFLRPVAGITTQVESGASNITTPAITTDYDAVVRAGNTGYTGTGLNPDMGAFEFEGQTPAPVIVLNTISPAASTQCTSTARVVTVNVSTAGGTITAVNLAYTVNGTAQTPIAMTMTSGTTVNGVWTGTIPVPSPTNATITWAVVASNSLGINTTYAGTVYADEPLTGVAAQAQVSNATVCDGIATSLTTNLYSASPMSASTYGIPVVSSPTTDEDLGNVTITQGATTILNNTSAINSLSGSIGTATGTAGSYSNYTSFGPYALTAGQSYNFSLSTLQATSPYDNLCAIYIDYNRNGVFTDAGEAVYVASAATSGAHTETGAFTVPASANNGLTRMRVIVKESSTSITSPTASFSWGEFEDYMINITGSSNNGGGLAPAITTVSWSDGTTTVGTGNPLSVSPAVTTTYTATITASGCTVSPSPSVTVTVNPKPTAPVATNSSQCGYQIPTASVSDPNGFVSPTINWYDVSTGGTVLQSSTSNTFTTAISTTTTFYVSVVNPSTGCESNRTAVTVTVSTPDAISASVSFSTSCLGTSTSLSVVNTNATPVQSYTYSWISTTGSGAETATAGAALTVTPTAAGTYEYIVTGTDNSCSAADTVSVIVHPFPTGLTASSSTTAVCQGSSVNLFANGTSNSALPTTVLTEGFEVWTPTGWTFINAGSGNAWESSSTAYSGTKSMYYAYNYSYAANAWAMTPAINVTAGVTYTLTFWYKVGLSSYPEKLKVTVGNAATVVGQTTTLWDNNGGTGLTNTTWAQATLNYVATTSGTVYFGFNCYSNTNMYNLYVDEVVVTSVVNPVYSWTSTPVGFTSSLQNPTGVTPAVPTTYTVQMTNNYGCSASASTSVSINALPTVSAGSDVTVCSGNNVTLNGAGAVSYSWNNSVSDNVAFAPASSADYVVTGTDANGCSNTDTVHIAVNALPTVSAGSDQAVCAGTSATLTVSGTATTYAWNYGVTDGVSFTPASTLTYTVTGTDANGCSNADSAIVTVNVLPAVSAGADQVVCTGSSVTLAGSGASTYSWDNGITDNTAFTPTTAATYIVTGTDVNGCTNTDTVDVTVNALPVVSAGLDQTICAGSTVTLAGSGASTYSWDNSVTDNTAFTPSVTASYVVSGTDANGCMNTDTVSVVVNALPVATATDNGNATVSASAGTTYQWINCGTGLAISGATTQTYTVTVNGSYAVVVTNAEGCSDTSSCISIDYLGIKDLDQNAWINVYPNPTRENVIVTFPTENATVRVTDAQGKLLNVVDIQNEGSVSLADYETGVYFLEIKTVNGTALKRIVKQ